MPASERPDGLVPPDLFMIPSRTCSTGSKFGDHRFTFVEVASQETNSTFGTLLEAVKMVRHKTDYVRALRELEALLYAEAG